jgi:UDP-glucose 4-epimerase
MKPLIIGGAGYIGSHVNKYLSLLGVETVIVDNLSRGHKSSVKWGKFYEIDFGDRDKIRKVFIENQIDTVMHLSAFAYVGESVSNPSLYYHNNVFNTTVLLDVMIEQNVKNFIFSSSCATYGNAEYLPIDEIHPQFPVNPYGFTKFVVERILKDYEQAYGLNSVILRYFNAAGSDKDGEIGENHEPETHIIPILLEVAKGKRKNFHILGDSYSTSDGTCIRDYLHVWDIAQAHQLAMSYLRLGGKSDQFNLGLEKGYSVLEVIEVVKKITKRDIPFEIKSPRLGDPAVLISSNKKAKKILHWNPVFTDLEEMISSAWNWTINQK